MLKKSPGSVLGPSRVPASKESTRAGLWDRGPRSLLYLCGTDRLARGIREELAVRSEGTTLTGNVVTLGQLVEHYTLPGELVGPEEVRLRVWAELRRSSRSRSLGGTLGFASALVELWELLRKEGTSAAVAAPEEAVSVLVEPVLTVMRALGSQGRLDQASLLLDLPRRVRSAPPRLETLIVDGFEGFPPVLAALVEALAEVAEEAWVLTEGDTLHPPSWTPERPMSLGARVGPRSKEPAVRPPAVPGAVLDAWVRGEPPVLGPRPLPNVRLLEGLGGEREEVEAMARAVRDALREDPTLRVVVALPALPTYAPRVLEVFPRFGLRPEVLLPLPLIAAPGAQPVRRLLELLSSDVPHVSMMELVEDLEELGTLGRFFREGTTVEDIGRVTREARAFAGREAFTSLLRAHATTLRSRKEEGAARRAEAVEEGFASLLTALDPLGSPAVPRAFVQTLRDVLRLLGYEGQSGPQGPSHVLEALSKAAEGLSEPGAPWSPNDLRQFTEIALSLHQGPPGSRLPGVPVTGLHDAGLLAADLVILGGLSEANLPADRPSPLLAPGARARAGLPTGEELVHRERVRLARVLARGGKNVVLTHPSRAADEEVLPSLLLNDLLAVASPVVERPATDLGHGHRAYALAEAMSSVAREISTPGGLSPAAASTLRLGLEGPRSEAWRSMLRGIRVERERRASPRATSFDGPMGGAAALALARRRFAAARFTVHDVQEYLRCPYRFYLERVLRLQFAEEVTDEVDRSAVGKEVHHQLFHLQNAVRTSDGKLEPLTDAEVRARQGGLQRELREFLLTLRPRTPDLETLELRLVGTARDPDDSAVSTMLRQLVDDASTVRSTHLELPFDGRPPREGEDIDPLARLPPLPLEEVDDLHPTLVGRIDRLGYGRGHPGGLVVDDYKTGRSRPKDQDAARTSIPAGLDLQLPLYMAAALYGLRQQDPSVFPLAMRFLWISSPGETGFVPLLRLPRKASEESRQRERGVAYVELALRHAHNAARGILSGRFPVNGHFSSADGGCQFAGFCDFARGCRFSQPRFSMRGAP